MTLKTLARCFRAVMDFVVHSIIATIAMFLVGVLFVLSTLIPRRRPWE